MRKIMQHPQHTGGSDGSVPSQLSRPCPTHRNQKTRRRILVGTKVHPRAWGTFPRFIGHYSRELNIVPLREMVAHLTSRSAKVLNIYPDRGSVSVGAAADLVLFNPETIKDLATYEQPKTRSVGIEMVMVNGVVAFEGGELTGARAGVTLRRRKDGKVTGKGL